MALVILLFELGSGLYLLMGLVHVTLVLWDERRGELFLPVDQDRRQAMGSTTLALSSRLSLMSTFRGLNLSHGLGITVFGLVGTYLARSDFGGIQPGVIFAIAATYSCANLAVALRYWFSLPVLGYGIGAALFLAAAARYWIW